MLLRDLSEPEDAGHVARKLISALGEPLRKDHVTLKLGASIGIALQGEGLSDFDSLLRAADAAMYAAKDSGRNTFHYYSQDVLLRAQRRLSSSTRCMVRWSAKNSPWSTSRWSTRWAIPRLRSKR